MRRDPRAVGGSARQERGAGGRPIVPREHGAWAVLYGAFVAGVGVAGQVTVAAALLLGVVTLLALMNAPLTVLLRPAHSLAPRAGRQGALTWLVVYGGGAAAFLVSLLVISRLFFLLPLGIVGLCAFGLRAWLVRRGRDRSLAGEIFGAAGLALVGAAAHAVAVGQAQPIAVVLWLLLSLFFASGVFYVRMRIRVMAALRRGAEGAAGSARRWCIAYHVVLLLLVPALAVGGLIPWPALLAFAPAIWRAAAGVRRRDAALNVRRLGWSEVGLTAAFVLTLVVSLSGRS